MSDKIKSKDLSYNSSLPPFLQRLHAQKGGYGDQDRHERQIARPKRAKDANEDDGPTVVDERGETLSKDEYKVLTQASDALAEGGNVTGEPDPSAEPMASGALPVDSHVAEDTSTRGATRKKRKAARIIGSEDQDDAAERHEAPKKATKKAKKSKPVKLTFDDDQADET